MKSKKIFWEFLKITSNKSIFNFSLICLLLIITFILEALSIFSITPIISILAGENFNLNNEDFEKFLNIFISDLNLYSVIYFLVFCVVFKSIFLIFSIYIQTKISLTAIKNIQKNIFKGLIVSNYKYLSSFKTGHISNYIFPEMERLRKGANTINSIVLNTFGVLVLFLGSIYVNVEISLFFILSGFIIGSSFLILNNFFSKQGKLQTLNRNIVLNNIEFLLHNIKNFKIINKNFLFKKKIYSSINSLFKSELLITISKKISIMYEPMIVVVLALLIIFLGIDKMDNIIGDLVIIILIFNRIFGKINSVASNFSALHLYESPLVKINEILTNQNNNKESFSGLKNFSLKKNILIDKLNFKHNSKVIFDSLSLKIKAGKTTSIYGGSGKGKTTLADLLIKLYLKKNYTGIIKFDDQDIEEINPIYLRNQIAYITQDTYLFDETVRFNLIFSNESSKDKIIIEYINLFDLSNIFDDNKVNLDKQIVSGGSNISGGQKQRLLIIRELIKKPKLIIFDEGLSSLENNNKLKILNEVRNLLPSVTIINLTHDNFFRTISDDIIEL
tara:strand:- start:881 stop:2560 length:1680 start_codon:yes stop_codon:yes gene_type:complete